MEGLTLPHLIRLPPFFAILYSSWEHQMHTSLARSHISLLFLFVL
jgi:hypothetical protein